MGASQPPAGATPPRAPKRGDPGAPMAHRGRGRLPPPPPRPDKDFVASLCVVNGTLECPPQEGPQPYQELPGGFSRHLQDALFPPWIIGHGSMTTWEARIVGEEWARQWGRWCAATRAPETPAQRYAAIPLEGWGPHTRPRPTMIRGAGPDHPWDGATEEWLQAAPGPQTGWTGDVFSLVRTPVPPRIVLHAANVLRATETRKWGHDTVTVRWHPPEDGAARLSVVHFKTGGPVYDDALSWLGDTQGPLLLMLPTNIAAALRQELHGCDGLRVGWEAVADGALLALLHRDAADGCPWDTLAPHLTGRHVYMATPPPGAPSLGVGRPYRRLPRPRDSPRRHVAGGPAEDARQGLPAPRHLPPAGDSGPPRTEVGQPLAPPSRPLVAALPPPTHLPALRGMRHGVLRSADRRQQVRAVHPGGRVPLAQTSRGPAQAHGGGGLAPARRGSTRPLTRMRGPRGRCRPVDPRAPAESHIRCAPVARVRALTPTRRRPLQSPQYHATPTGGAQEATVRGLVADAVAEAHEAHAAARRDRTGSARAFLNKTALRAVHALNGAGAPTLLPAMHRIVNAIQPGLIGPEAALYGDWMEGRESNRSDRPLSMGDTPQLTGAGSAMSLRSSAPALLHALRTRYPGETAPCLNQARSTYRGGVSELDAALHLLHPPDEDLEVGEITVFVEGADEAPALPRPTNPVYDGTRPTPPYTIVCEAFPREPTWCPALPPATHAPRGWAHPDLSPPLSGTRGAHHRGQVLWQERPGTPLLLLVVATRGDPERVLGITSTRLYGAAPVPRLPLLAPAARDGVHTFLRTQEVIAVTGVHLVRLPPAPPDDPRGLRAPEPRPRLGAVARRVGRVAPPPPVPMPMDGHRPPPVRG